MAHSGAIYLHHLSPQVNKGRCDDRRTRGRLVKGEGGEESWEDKWSLLLYVALHPDCHQSGQLLFSYSFSLSHTHPAHLMLPVPPVI